MNPEDYSQIKTRVMQIMGINLDPYKDEQMKRRLDSWLSRSGIPTWSDYFHKIKSDENELKRFRDYLTINVTEFFRDSERWQYLRQNVIPDLLKASVASGRLDGTLRIWSAGCSIGAEPFSLSIMMDELTPGKKHTVFASDLDWGALNKAKAGGPFATDEVRNVSPVEKSTYFKPGGPPFFVTNNLIQKVTFKELNLLQDAFDKNYDLIVCRNVVIYFTTETKTVLYQKFRDALRPGGVLFVGGTEIIPRPQEFGLKSTGFSFYIRI
jgi:chemotaxis protein methyltransferase CheR